MIKMLHVRHHRHTTPQPSLLLVALLLFQVGDSAAVLKAAAAHGVNLRALDAKTVTAAFDETTKLEDVDLLFK